MSGSKILGTVHRDGDDVYVSLPLQVLAAAGINVGDVVEVSSIEKTIRLASLDRSEPNIVLDSLVASVHEEALNFLRGMWLLQNDGCRVRLGVGWALSKSVAQVKKDIESVRILIARLEHGSMP